MCERRSVFDQFVKPRPRGVATFRCPDCLGYGEKCLSGEPAHPENFYTCESCDGIGHIYYRRWLMLMKLEKLCQSLSTSRARTAPVRAIPS